ncbi:MAG: NADP-specific glutamate dehydrogenase [Sandaracinaceae bacterium]
MEHIAGLTGKRPDDYDVDGFMDRLQARTPGEPEFHQAVHEVLGCVVPVVKHVAAYREAAIIERLVEPDRVIAVRVVWLDDEGCVRVNRAWRVQFNNALGPYKGGLRFHPSVDLGQLKFLGFEQTLKDALTGLPIGGAKGGADFDPKGKSDAEVMRFCQALMTELFHYIGPDVDVPAGDIGVGEREIGYLFGQYKRLQDRFDGALTGKSTLFGGSVGRVEATGHGCVSFLAQMLEEHGKVLEGKRVAVSGAGNVSLHAAEKLLEQNAKVVTLSDTSGFVHAPKGLDEDQLDTIRERKAAGDSLSDIADGLDLKFEADARPWGVDCEIALPCATQNELERDDARKLAKAGCVAVAEGANMPTTPGAVDVLRDAGVLFAPGKAANAGGVAVSALEMSQNALGLPWSRERVERRLQEVMSAIHDRCVEHGRRDDGTIDYVRGANVAAFRRVADAMVAQGIV